MKKILLCVLTMALAIFVLTACGGNSDDSSDDQKEEKTGINLEELKTLGDAFDLETEDDQFESDYKTFVYVFEKDDVAYRVRAELTKDVAKKYEKLDAADQDYSDKVKEVVAPMEITKRENLTEMIPSQEELDKYVGKTGKDMINDGWEASGFETDGDESRFTVGKGPFNFTVVVDAKVKEKEEFDTEKEFSPLKIKSVKYLGLGNATSVDEEGEDD